ncbi:MAG: class I SAM-dependent methyltransferase [Bacteroidota bacterium]|nr:class I SAM-dependent methyltransferase [Bacteroidota bacterium]
MKIKDYLVSNKVFSIVYNSELDMYHTSPVPDNLDKYYESEEYISHTDRKKTFIEKIYHIVRDFSFYSKEKKIAKLTNKKTTILDIGAGTADFLVYLKSKGWDTLAFEPNQSASDIGKNKQIEYIEQLDKVPDNWAEVITMWHVLEHIEDLDNQIKELKRICKPDGYIVIAVPNFKSFDAQYYKQFWAAYDVPRHLHHFSKTSIELIFRKHQILLKQIKPMYFDSFYVSILSEKYKTGKNNLFKAFCIGLYSNIYGMFKKEYSSHIYILKNDKK